MARRSALAPLPCHSLVVRRIADIAQPQHLRDASVAFVDVVLRAPATADSTLLVSGVIWSIPTPNNGTGDNSLGAMLGMEAFKAFTEWGWCGAFSHGCVSV